MSKLVEKYLKIDDNRQQVFTVVKDKICYIILAGNEHFFVSPQLFAN